MAIEKITPLNWQTPIVAPETGYPTNQFIRLWQQSFGNIETNTSDIEGKADKTTLINTTGGIQGGGDLSADRTLSLTDTGVTAGSYTSANITVDAKGRLSAASNGGGGSGSVNIKQAGTTIVTGATDINFASGATVAAAGTQANVTIVPLATQDEGSALGATTTMNFVGTGVTATYSAGTATVTIPGAAGGSSKWTLLNSWNFAVSGAIAALDTTSITNDEILVITTNVIKSVASRPTIYVSTNNGTSYDTSATYGQLSATGTLSSIFSGFFLDTSSVTTATSGEIILSLLSSVGQKIGYASSSNTPGWRYSTSTAVINAIRVTPTSVGTFNGGQIFIYGRN